MNSKRNLRHSILILILIAAFFACSKKSDNPVAPAPQTTELKLTVGTQQITFSQGIGGYAIQENITYVQFLKTEGGDTLLFILLYPGKQTGNQNWDPSQDIGVFLIQYGSSGNIALGPVNGSTNITSYGNVGSAIAGSFNGVLVDDDNNQVNVSGNFSVIRNADINTIGKPVVINDEILKQLKIK